MMKGGRDSDEVVRLEDVKRHYTVGDETVKALDGVSFSIRRGSSSCRMMLRQPRSLP